MSESEEGFYFPEPVTKPTNTTKPTGAQIAYAYIANRTKGMVHHQGRNYRYDGCRYVRVTDDDLRHDVCRYLMREKQAHTPGAVNAAVACIEALANRDACRYEAMPFTTGADDYPENLIPFRNGLLDLDAYLGGEVKSLPHSPAYVDTFCLPYDFDPAATCPQWQTFLDDVLDADPERIGLIQEWFGYCLTDDTSQQKVMVKVGASRAGKGTTDRVLKALIGDQYATGFDLHSLAETHGPSQLENKRLALIGEVNLVGSHEKYRIMEKFNSIVGGDPVTINRKGDPEIRSMTLPVRFNISCNELPVFNDPAGAVANRLLLLPFYNSKAGKEDTGLADRLLTELPGVAVWALEGLRRLRANGRFTSPGVSKSLLSEYRRVSSVGLAFLQDRLCVHRRLSPGGIEGVGVVEVEVELTADQLKNVFADWCNENMIQHSYPSMTKQLQAVLPKLKPTKQRRNGTPTNLWPGIGLAAPATAPI